MAKRLDILFRRRGLIAQQRIGGPDKAVDRVTDDIGSLDGGGG
jgi:hypothetical protein